MHSLGMVLMWTAIQVTVIFSIVAILLRFAGQSEPLWRGKIILTGIVSSLLVSACAVSPWPSWPEYWGPNRTQLAASEESSTAPRVESQAARNPRSLESQSESPSMPPSPTERSDEELPSAWSAGWTAFLEQMKTPRALPVHTPQSPAPTESAFTISSVIALLALLGVGLGLMRLLAGIWLLRREVSRSRVIHEERVRSAIGKILNSSETPRIEIRVTGKLRSAATTGILRPVILLPACWETWSDEELLAVLAHELNHISRKDCLTALCAELARVLHFYHPLMHWLANRLRLEQELAADAEAARFLGGQNRYLCILAEMALNETSRAPAWPARAFLPSHRTFMRRIEMLKNNPLNPGRVSRFGRCAALAFIGLATLFALGLRDPGNTATAQEGKPAPVITSPPDPDFVVQSNRQTDKTPFPLTYVPEDAIGVIAVRPKELFAQPALKPLAEAILKNEALITPVPGMRLDQIEQVVWSYGLRDTFPPEPMLIAYMVRTSGKWDLGVLKEHLTPKSGTAFYGGQLYLKETEGQDVAFWLANEQTLIFSDSEAGLRQAIDARNTSLSREKGTPIWDPEATNTVAIFAHIGNFRQRMDHVPGGPGGGLGGGGFGGMGPAKQATMGLNPMFGPLWNDVERVVGGLSFDDGIQAKLTAESKDGSSSVKVKETLNAMRILGRNMIEQNQQMIGQLPQDQQEIIGVLLGISQEVLKTVKLEQQGVTVVLDARLSDNAAKLFTTALVPAVESAQIAARRSQGMGHLKQIGVAMHNYHNTHGYFPSPVVIGPDGKTPHSWRVALLPYIDEAELYRQYKFDEPWDSENNKKLLEKIPNTYRHPLDKKGSTNASYFALVGKNTLMGDGERPTRIRDIVDGTSNTLMIVEAKREIPWTKPEDIPYDEDRTKAPPELGGWFKEGFSVVFGDGSVRLIPKTIAKTTLQNLIERNDGNPTNRGEFEPRPVRSGSSSRSQPPTPFGGGRRGGGDEAYDGPGEAKANEGYVPGPRSRPSGGTRPN